MKIALVGNYSADRQESMRRYTALLGAGLAAAGHDVTVAEPRATLNRRGRAPAGLWKWIGYLDKYCVGYGDIAAAARRADVVHVCDHSNSVYVPRRAARPYVVTCHDLLAVRGALGESTDCPASAAGRLLQGAILRGLRRATAVACVSAATLHDARRLLGSYRGQLAMIPNALAYPYRRLPPDVVAERLRTLAGLPVGTEYVLHVGSNLRRKNRECVLRALAEIAPAWPGRVVMAGEPLTAELAALARALGVAERVVEIPGPSNECLEALYNGAMALVFPSRFEGFGWPVVEAQACGCPVLCSDREPFPEVAGDGAIMCGADDHAAFGQAIAALARDPCRRSELAARGLRNAERYSRDSMLSAFVALYEQVAARA
jgi:glycosyltransferase involved in cell wall biosynthesis